MPRTAPVPRTVFAMPLGPPYGGMTEFAAMLRGSYLFAEGAGVLLDTTPPPVGTSRGGRLLHAVQLLAKLMALAVRSRAQVAYFMTSDYLGFFEKAVLAFFCRLMGMRVVLHPVGSFINFYGRAGILRPPIRFFLRRMNAIIAVHPQVQAYMVALAPSTPVWCIPNPVDCHLFQPASARAENGSRGVEVLFSGSLTAGKGVMEVLKAAALYRSELEGVKLILIGDGELADECRRFVQVNGLDGMVELRGFIAEDEKRCLLAHCDVYCLPSHSEGMPLSVLEAMASGLPIVSTWVGGIPNAVEEGRHGWLVAPGDVHGLGRCLVHLARNPAVRIAMGGEARKHVQERHDLPLVVDRLAALFVAIVGGPGTGTGEGPLADPRRNLSLGTTPSPHSGVL